jgi:hypothetical protein
MLAGNELVSGCCSRRAGSRSRRWGGSERVDRVQYVRKALALANVDIGFDAWHREAKALSECA